MSNALHNNFLKAVEKLQLKFPVKEIADKTGYKPPIVSEYLNSKKLVSENFAKAFCTAYDLDYDQMLVIDLNEEGYNYDTGGNLVTRIYNKWMAGAAEMLLGKPDLESMKELHALIKKLKEENDQLEKEG